MAALVERPGVLFLVSFAGFLVAAFLGVVAQRLWRPVRAGDQNELTIVQTAALTLLGLVVAFSFSMAVSRYDQRKNLEEAEANAIGTEYARADLMAEGAPAARKLLRQYLDQRILFYVTSDPDRLKQIRADTDKLAADLWALARSNALAEPTAVAALTASGMNDVLNSADYTTAAWLNRPDSGMVAPGLDRPRRQSHHWPRRETLQPSSSGLSATDRGGVPVPDRRHRQPARRRSRGGAAEFEPPGGVAEQPLSLAELRAGRRLEARGCREWQQFENCAPQATGIAHN